MDITRGVFWREAMKGGTVIGLAMVGIMIVSGFALPEGSAVWVRVLRWLSYAVLACLIFGFTRRIARMASPAEGFPFARCVGFVMAMMTFVGLICGLYSSIVMNFVIPREDLAKLADAMVSGMAAMMPAGQSNNLFDMALGVMRSPIVLVLSNMIGYWLLGGFIGLFVGAFVKKNPNPFAGEKSADSE